MSADIIAFKTGDGVVGDGAVLPVSCLFDGAKEVGAEMAVLLCYGANGDLEVFATHGVPQSFLLASQGAAYLLNASGRVGQ